MDLQRHESIISDVLMDLRKRHPLPMKWTDLFLDEARTYVTAIASRSSTLEQDLRVWGATVWTEYGEAAAAEEAAQLAEARRLEDEAEAPYRERRERLWTSDRSRREARQVRAIIEARGVSAVYHWTEAENLPSILRHGLISRTRLRKLGISPRTHSFGSPLKEAQLADYVGVMLLPHEGMIMKAVEPIVLELEPAVLATSGALFVPGNSARNDIHLSDHAALSRVEALDELFESPVGARVRDWQSEVWIPERITPLAITAVAARSQATLRSLQAKWDQLFGKWPYPVTPIETQEWNQISSVSIDDI